MDGSFYLKPVTWPVFSTAGVFVEQYVNTEVWPSCSPSFHHGAKQEAPAKYIRKDYIVIEYNIEDLLVSHIN